MHSRAMPAVRHRGLDAATNHPEATGDHLDRARFNVATERATDLSRVLT